MDKQQLTQAFWSNPYGCLAFIVQYSLQNFLNGNDAELRKDIKALHLKLTDLLQIQPSKENKSWQGTCELFILTTEHLQSLKKMPGFYDA